MQRLGCVFILVLAACSNSVGGSARDDDDGDARIGDTDVTDDNAQADEDLQDDVDLPGGPIAEVIAAMPHGSWKRLAGTRLADVCPDTMNHYVCDAVMGAWSGAAYDQSRERFIVMGGGHADSFLNNVFVFDVLQGTWSRATELPAGLDHLPDGGAVPPVFDDGRIEPCGLYPSVGTLSIPAEWLTPSGYLMHQYCDDESIVAQLDAQQPRSAHTYGNLAATNGKFYVLGSIGMYKSGQSASPRVSIYDFSAAHWTRGPDNNAIAYGTAAVGSDGNVYYVGDRQAGKLDVTAGTWTPIPNSGDANGYYAGAAVDTTRGTLVVTTDGLQLQTWSLASGAYTAITATGLASSLAPAPGFAYAPDDDRFYAWNGGNTLYVLDPTTHAWTAVTGAGDDPGARASWGTFGRFRYSNRLRVFVVVNTTTTDVFLFKP